jgi:chromosome segregation ATPase
MDGWQWVALGTLASWFAATVTLVALYLRERRLRHEELEKLVNDAVAKKIGDEVGTTFFNLLRTQNLLEQRVAGVLAVVHDEAHEHREEMSTLRSSAQETIEVAKDMEKRLRQLVELAQTQTARVEKQARRASDTVDALVETAKAELARVTEELMRISEIEAEVEAEIASLNAHLSSTNDESNRFLTRQRLNERSNVIEAVRYQRKHLEEQRNRLVHTRFPQGPEESKDE